MNNKLLLMVMATALLSVSACKKFLDVEPQNLLQNDIAIAGPGDLANVVEGIYDGMQSGAVLGGNRVIYADLFADDAKVITTRLSPFGTLEMYERSMTSQINDLRNMWRECYGTINRANIVLDVIERGELNNHPDYNARDFALYKAVALFARAAVHFEMVRFWAQPYDPAAPGNNAQLGIPYRTQPTLSGPDGLAMARHTVEEVYTNVIADFNSALHLLDTLGDGDVLYANWYKHRIDRWAARAYLSRVYFYKGDYAQSAAQAEAVIASGRFALADAPRDNFTRATTGSTAEQIFQLISLAQDRTGTPVWGYSRFGSPLLRPDRDAMSAFHAGDKRLNNVSGYFYVSFFGDSTIAKYDLPNAVNGTNMCVLRLGELYLNAAEAYLSAGGGGNAVRAGELYSELYEKRTGTPPTLPPTPEELLDAIRLERRLELMFEGDRYHNLRRLKLPLRDGVPYNDPALLFKIPQEEMSGNALMVQNS